MLADDLTLEERIELKDRYLKFYSITLDEFNEMDTTLRRAKECRAIYAFGLTTNGQLYVEDDLRGERTEIMVPYGQFHVALDLLKKKVEKMKGMDR